MKKVLISAFFISTSLITVHAADKLVEKERAELATLRSEVKAEQAALAKANAAAQKAANGPAKVSPGATEQFGIDSEYEMTIPDVVTPGMSVPVTPVADMTQNAGLQGKWWWKDGRNAFLVHP